MMRVVLRLNRVTSVSLPLVGENQREGAIADATHLSTRTLQFFAEAVRVDGNTSAETTSPSSLHDKSDVGVDLLSP